jgi:enoyl-CoA hydratase
MGEHGPAVVTEERDGTLLVTLARPHARNAIDGELSEGVAAALELLDARADLRVAILTGAGGTFCSGMDLRAWNGRPAEAEVALDRLVRARPRKPVIAAVEGYAVGGGLELALTHDLVVAARDAQFGVPEVRRALVPSGGALLRLPERLPFGVAMDLALTGDMVGAERLHALGLVSRLAEPGGALDAALAVAATIGANGPQAVRESKALLRARLDPADDAAWTRQAELTRRTNASADAHEGIAAFLEKRAPVYRDA